MMGRHKETWFRRIGIIISDHARALIWSGRPVIVMRLDRNKYFSGWNGYFKSKKYRIDPDRLDGNIKTGFVPIVRIFEPCEIDPVEVLRHECMHIRVSQIKEIDPVIADEAVGAFLRDPVSADYTGPGGNILSESIVRLAERRCLGLPLPSMSPGLSKLVRSVTRPAPVLAAAHLAVFTLLALAFLSALSAAVAAPRIDLQSSDGSQSWRWYTCVNGRGGWVTGEADNGPDGAAWQSMLAVRGMSYFPEISPPCDMAASMCEGKAAGSRIIEQWRVGDRSRFAAPPGSEHQFAGRWILTC